MRRDEVGERVRTIVEREGVLQVPAVFAAEVVSALRRQVDRGNLSEGLAGTALERLAAAQRVEYPFAPFQARVWELRPNVTTYDAWYVALAEALGTDLVTTDTRLVDAPGPRCEVRLP